MVAQKALVGMACVRITNDKLGWDNVGIHQTNTLCGTIFNQDFINLDALADMRALGLDYTGHGAGNFLHTTHGVMYAEFLLEVGNQRID